jgi:hypothetical protein
MYKLLAAGVFSLSLSAGGVDAAADASTTCHACMAATQELRKAVPVLKRESVSADDKALALGDAVGSACAGYNFAGLDRSSDLAEACTALLKGGDWAAVQAALVAGAEPAVACAAPCASVAADKRAPPTAAPKSGKAKAKTDKDGTVEDPAYKAVRREAGQRQRAPLQRRETLD